MAKRYLGLTLGRCPSASAPDPIGNLADGGIRAIPQKDLAKTSDTRISRNRAPSQIEEGVPLSALLTDAALTEVEHQSCLA